MRKFPPPLGEGRVGACMRNSLPLWGRAGWGPACGNSLPLWGRAGGACLRKFPPPLGAGRVGACRRKFPPLWGRQGGGLQAEIPSPSGGGQGGGSITYERCSAAQMLSRTPSVSSRTSLSQNLRTRKPCDASRAVRRSSGSRVWACWPPSTSITRWAFRQAKSAM